MRFEGIYTPIVTPHRDDHSIDRDRFSDLMLDKLILSEAAKGSAPAAAKPYY